MCGAATSVALAEFEPDRVSHNLSRYPLVVWLRPGAFLVVAGAGRAGDTGAAIIGLPTAPPALRDRVHELEQRLRCPVCKSVSIAESPSETAEAMRVAVAEQVAAARSDQGIVDYFRVRHGDRVLHTRPRPARPGCCGCCPQGALLSAPSR